MNNKLFDVVINNIGMLDNIRSAPGKRAQYEEAN